MKISYLSIFVLGLFIMISSCRNDDDGLNLLPQAEQNEVDDRALVKFLEDHYFNSVGKIVRFSDEISSDDDETPLMEYAELKPSGIWVVHRPNFEATGRKVTNVENDSILIQYDLNGFVGQISNDSVFYSIPTSISTTINTTGYPIWDPSFYYTNVSGMTNARKSWYEMEGLQEGLKEFHSTNKNAADLPAVDFQGLILVPSRLVFQRDYNVFNLGPDTSIFFNFELYQVVDRQ